MGVSSTRAKSFDAGVETTRGDTLVRRGTMCEGTRGRRGGAGDGAGAAGGESGRRLAVQLVRVSFGACLGSSVGLRAMVTRLPAAVRLGRAPLPQVVATAQSFARVGTRTEAR